MAVGGATAVYARWRGDRRVRSGKISKLVAIIDRLFPNEDQNWRGTVTFKGLEEVGYSWQGITSAVLPNPSVAAEGAGSQESKPDGSKVENRGNYSGEKTNLKSRRWCIGYEK